MFSFLRLKLFSIICYEKKKIFFKKIKNLLRSLKKHSKILPFENSGGF